MLNEFFKLEQHGTTVRREVTAGVTTFLTMAYIVFVNPAILSEAGMDSGGVFVATCLAAAVGTAIMGLWANYPIAMAPGMGLNAFFTYGVVLGMGYPWQVALGAVFVSGVLFVGISVLPVREWIVNSIPKSLKMGTVAGIGLLLGIIAMQNAGLVVDNSATLVGLGDMGQPSVLLAALGFAGIVALDRLRVTGAIVIGILGVTVIGAALGISEFNGIVALPPDPGTVMFRLDIGAALDLALVGVIFAFLFTDLFDTSGTLIAVAHRAGLLDENGQLPRLRRALVADSLATVFGAAAGTSSVTCYIESAAGVRAGGRTGLTAVVVAGLFLAALLLSPLAATVPAYATAPALLFVACLMMSSITEIDWEDVTEYVPAAALVMTMPFTFSIANGLAVGFISYAAIKLLSGRFATVNPAVGVLAALFVCKFAWLG
ncbi:NCS2 family permease [Candidatus Rariloculus sp.]|uniref:NCS2 family permease n=1 Tax=Candidatus Rariloculus sp. TaxID=3101265 RepID=UPI003D119A39